MPPPRMTTDLPTPTFGQSPGRGDCKPGGDGGGGFGAVAGAADDDPQLASEVPMPIAPIVLNIAELPTALPTAVRNSRRRNAFRSVVTPSPVLLAIPVLPKKVLQNRALFWLFRLTSRPFHYSQYDPEPCTEFPNRRSLQAGLAICTASLMVYSCRSYPIPESQNNAGSQN